MRAQSIPELGKGLKTYFGIRAPGPYLDTKLMLITRKISLDILALDDFLHEKHGNYEEEQGLSMSELITKEYGTAANSFVVDNM